MVPNDDVNPSVINFILYEEDPSTNIKTLKIHQFNSKSIYLSNNIKLIKFLS